MAKTIVMTTLGPRSPSSSGKSKWNVSCSVSVRETWGRNGVERGEGSIGRLGLGLKRKLRFRAECVGGGGEGGWGTGVAWGVHAPGS